MAEGNGSAANVTLVQVTFDHDTGKLGIHGVSPSNRLAVTWLLEQARMAVMAQVGKEDINAAVGLGRSGIVAVRGELPPFDEHGVRRRRS